MAEAIALPLGVSLVKGVGQVVTREGESAVKAIIEFFRGLNFDQRINRQQIIRDILRNLNKSYPEYNLAILAEGVYFLDREKGMEKLIMDSTFKIEGFRHSFEIRILIFKTGYITILDHALKDPERWGKFVYQ